MVKVPLWTFNSILSWTFRRHGLVRAATGPAMVQRRMPWWKRNYGSQRLRLSNPFLLYIIVGLPGFKMMQAFAEAFHSTANTCKIMQLYRSFLDMKAQAYRRRTTSLLSCVNSCGEGPRVCLQVDPCGAKTCSTRLNREGLKRQLAELQAIFFIETISTLDWKWTILLEHKISAIWARLRTCACGPVVLPCDAQKKWFLQPCSAAMAFAEVNPCKDQ